MADLYWRSCHASFRSFLSPFFARRHCCRPSLSRTKPLYVVTHIDVYPNFAADTTAVLKQFAADSLKDCGRRAI